MSDNAEVTAEETNETAKVEKTLEEQLNDWKSHARTWETRAKDGQEAIAKLQEIEDAKKSELEKATERAAQLEADLAEAKHAALKNGLAAEFGLSAEDSSLFLTAGDEEGLRKQAEALVSRISKASETEAPVMGNVIPGLIQRKTDSNGSQDDFVRKFWGI